MEYFVIGPDGQKYGPADVPTLNQWAQQGRVLATTMLENGTTGDKVLAGQLAGLAFPPPPNQANPYQANPYASYPRGTQLVDDGSRDFTMSWVFSLVGFLSLCMCPLFGIVFSVLAIVFAVTAKKKDHPKAKLALGLAITSLVIPLIFIGVLFAASLIPPPK